MHLICSPWLSSRKILHISLFVCFWIISDFNASESCWSDSPGKLEASHLHASRGCASCPASAEDRSSAASCTIYAMNNRPSAQAARDEAGVRVPNFQAKEIHWALRQCSRALAGQGNGKTFKTGCQSIFLQATEVYCDLAPAREGKIVNNLLLTKNICVS